MHYIRYIQEKSLKKNTLLKEALDNSFEQEIEQGINQEKIDIAKTLLKKSMPIEDIIEITGLSLNQINESK
jgi:predicted transposase/invertase (TIGR01784 family)